MEKTFADGIYYNHKHPNAPEWVIASLSINPNRFIPWLESQEPDEKGYVKLQVKEGKEKPYIELDTYKRN